MFATFGLALAFATLVFWTVGDFYIQRSSRVVGTRRSLFAISLLGTLVPLPFLLPQIVNLAHDPPGIVLLSTLGCVIFFASLFELEALKRGKLAIVEPIFGLETPLTVGLCVALGVDSLSTTQVLLIALVVAGVTLTIFAKRAKTISRALFEKGIVLAGLGALAMSLSIFLTGVGSRETNPFLTIWFVNAFMTLGTLVFLIAEGGGGFLKDIRRYYKVILQESVFDNLAWYSFASAMVFIPVSIATAIAESYIVFSVVLGVRFNREQVALHQYVGVALAVAGIIGLSLALTG